MFALVLMLLASLFAGADDENSRILEASSLKDFFFGSALIEPESQVDAQ